MPLSLSLQNRLQRELENRAAHSLKRELRDAPDGVLDLASNDYLGLARHEEVIQAACKAARKYGAGARASRLVGGNCGAHEELEGELAKFKKQEAALVFSSGFAANLGVVGALAQRDDWIFCDKRNHASLIDACRLAAQNGARVRYYSNIEKLRALLQAASTREENSALRFVVSDSVYSMDGDVAEVPRLLRMCDEFDATLILDDAHGTGVLGADGGGAASHFALHEGAASTRMVEIGTLSKALGAQGGFVVGPQLLIDYLVNAARPFIYTTGLAPATCGAARASLEIIAREPQRVARLHEVTKDLCERLRALGFQIPRTESAIVPVIAGDENRALRWSENLLGRGVWCPAIRPPTVPRGTSRLRVTASAALSRDDIDRAVAAFASLEQ
jgi:8-amino-7-oxononanoate synthase